MKSILIAVVLSLSLGASAFAQKRTKPRASNRTRTSTREPASSAANKPRLIGSQVVIITKNDDRIAGTLLDLTAYSVRIRADNLESTIALDTIASLSFGSAGPPAPARQVIAPVRPEFLRDSDAVINSFQAIASQLKAGTEFTDYGRQLGDLRRTGEQFIARYGSTENATEARVLSLIAGALTDYSWARTIWTLKFSRSGDGGGVVFDTDSPAITDALSVYPDLRASAAAGNKFSVDKIVSGLWKKAAEKTDQARSLIASAK